MRALRDPLRFVPLAVAAVLAALVVLLFKAYFDEVRESRYDTYADAIAAGAVKHGWVPSQLPDSTHSIVEWHDLDTNEGEVRFRFRIGDLGNLERLCADLPRTGTPDTRSFMCEMEGSTFRVDVEPNGQGRAVARAATYE